MKKKNTNINWKTPKGWFLAGSHPFEYKANLDKKNFYSGTQSCRVTCKVKEPSGWTTLMQNMGPEAYLGKRLSMKFWVRTKDVDYVTGWMRVDGQSRHEMLSFDNMCNRKLEGTNKWIEQEIVLDVPKESTNIGFGIIFSGCGKMWIDNISFKTVTKKTPVTACPCHPNNHDTQPENLNFESNESE